MRILVWLTYIMIDIAFRFPHSLQKRLNKEYSRTSTTLLGIYNLFQGEINPLPFVYCNENNDLPVTSACFLLQEWLKKREKKRKRSKAQSKQQRNNRERTNNKEYRRVKKKQTNKKKQQKIKKYRREKMNFFTKIEICHYSEGKKLEQVEIIQDNIQHRIILRFSKRCNSGTPFFCNMTKRLWVTGSLPMFQGKGMSSSRVDMPETIRRRVQ